MTKSRLTKLAVLMACINACSSSTEIKNKSSRYFNLINDGCELSKVREIKGVIKQSGFRGWKLQQSAKESKYFLHFDKKALRELNSICKMSTYIFIDDLGKFSSCKKNVIIRGRFIYKLQYSKSCNSEGKVAVLRMTEI